MRREIDTSREDGEYNGSRVVYIALYYVPDELDVRLCSQTLRSALEDAGHVDYTKVLLVRAGDLETKYIPGERRSRLALDVVAARQSHCLVRLARCQSTKDPLLNARQTLYMISLNVSDSSDGRVLPYCLTR